MAKLDWSKAKPRKPTLCIKDEKEGAGQRFIDCYGTRKKKKDKKWAIKASKRYGK